MAVKTDNPNKYRPARSFAVLKTDCLGIYRPPTRFSLIETNSPNIYRFGGSFGVHKTNSLNVYRFPTGFLEVVRTDSPNLNRPPILFAVIDPSNYNFVDFKSLLSNYLIN